MKNCFGILAQMGLCRHLNWDQIKVKCFGAKIYSVTAKSVCDKASCEVDFSCSRCVGWYRTAVSKESKVNADQPWVHPPSFLSYSSGSSSLLWCLPPWPWFPPLCLWTPRPSVAPHWLLLYSAWPGHAPCHSGTPVGTHKQRSSDYVTCIPS